MARALTLARRGWGTTHPNPMVGAVLVDHGHVVGEGWHAQAGGPHAEVVALADYEKRRQQGEAMALSPEATFYVTLEPCSTTGRTPPCTEAIRRAGLRRVVIGAVDPDPRHQGKGIDLLRAAGCDVTTGVRAEEAEDLNLIFHHRMKTGRPLLAAKVAMTLDGRTATRTGESQWITGEAARADVHTWRLLFPAVAAGAGTILADNPRLTWRLAEGEGYPRRLVFDPHLRCSLRPRAHVFTDEGAKETVVVTSPEVTELPSAWQEHGVTQWRVPLIGHSFARDALLARLHEHELTGVLVEAGAGTLGRLLESGAVDYLIAYLAPTFLGDAAARPVADGPPCPALSQAWQLSEARWDHFGPDLCVRGFLQKPAPTP